MMIIQRLRVIANLDRPAVSTKELNRDPFIETKYGDRCFANTPAPSRKQGIEHSESKDINRHLVLSPITILKFMGASSYSYIYDGS